MDSRPLHKRLSKYADALEAKLRAASLFDGPDGQEVADLRSAASLAEAAALRAVNAATADPITAAMIELGAKVIGLVVTHNGYQPELLYDADNRGWCALGWPDAEDENGSPLQVNGDGLTPIAALDACTAACAEAEDMVLG